MVKEKIKNLAPGAFFNAGPADMVVLEHFADGRTLLAAKEPIGNRPFTVRPFTYNRTDQTYDGIEIAADVAFSGQEVPVIPTVVYFKSESDIEKLIQMRTGESQNRVQSKTYRFQCSNSSGISEREAGQIDALLRQIKCSGSASISSEAQRESRTDMEYHIEF